MNSARFTCRLIAIIGLFALCFAASGCASRSKGTVSYGGSKTASRPKTFAWLEQPAPHAMPAPGLADTAGTRRASWKALIGAELQSRGYKEVPLEDAECQIAFHLSSGRADVVEYLNQFKGYPASQVFNGPRGKVKSLAKDYTNGLGEPGMLIIDAIVPDENRFLWRGWAQTDLRPGYLSVWDDAAADKAVKIALARVPKP